MNQIVLRLAIVLIASLGVVTSHSAFAAKEAPLKMGTWENKDEDGDGIPDEQDDYPFDATKSQYPIFIEKEPNDNPSIATPITLGIGVKVQGVISSSLDKGDLFKFVVNERKSLTAFFKSSSARFLPQVYVSNKDGLVINEIFLYKYTKPNIYVVNFPIYDPGTYQLSVIDENFAGGADLTYEMVFFNDEDVDSFDDMKERAFGADLIENDMDKDKILDGLEYIFGVETTAIDLDKDSIPNWLDQDSDGDGFADKLEQSVDLDNDSYLNFLDLDADGNGIKDNVESGSSANPNDFDNDGIIDHLDLDDDGDNIFDINDINRLQAAKTIYWSKRGDLSIKHVSTIFENSKINFLLRAGDTFELTIEGFPNPAVSPVLIVSLKGTLYNLLPKSTTRDGDKSYLQFDLPIDSGEGEMAIVVGDIKSEPHYINVGVEQLPLLSVLNLKAVTAGSEISLLGDNFDKNTSVFFNENQSITKFKTANEIVVTIPNNIKSGSYSVNNAYGKSNYIRFVVQETVQVKVTQENALPIHSIGGLYPEFSKPLLGHAFPATKMTDNHEIIYTYIQNDDGELTGYLSAIQYKGDTVVEFNDESTAEASLVLSVIHFYRTQGFNTKELVNLIRTTNAYQQYIAESIAFLGKDTSFFSFKNRADTTTKFIDKYDVLIKEELVSNGLIKL